MSVFASIQNTPHYNSIAYGAAMPAEAAHIAKPDCPDILLIFSFGGRLIAKKRGSRADGSS